MVSPGRLQSSGDWQRLSMIDKRMIANRVVAVLVPTLRKKREGWGTLLVSANRSVGHPPGE